MIIIEDKFTPFDKKIIILHWNDFFEWFIGQNKNNEFFIGSMVEEDDEIGKLYYQYFIITQQELHLFLDKKCSYRELMDNKIVYSIVKHYNEEISDYKVLEESEIVFPHPKLYAPDWDYKKYNWLNLC